MKTLVLAVLAALCAGAALRLPQDPVKPAPEPAATPAAPAPQKDVPRRHPFEGVYRLHARTRNGVPELQTRARGYVAITARHLLLCLAAPGSDPAVPLVRAGVRTWKPQDEQVATVVEMGFYTDDDGAIHLEEHGKPELRRLELLRGRLRIWQDQREWLEFERIE